jgi:arylsulfatase A-like enzyme
MKNRPFIFMKFNLAEVVGGLFIILLITISPAYGSNQEEKEGSAKPIILEKSDIFIILLDSLRVDAIDRKVKDKLVMPSLNRWARKNITFTQAQSSSSSTPTSVSAMFTSLPVVAFKGSFNRRIPKEAPVLAEILSQNGYRCLGYSANPNCRSGLGHDRGFDKFIEAYKDKKFAKGEKIREDHPARIVDPDVLLDRVWKDLKPPPSKPVFVYIHLLQPHAPYRPPSPHRELFLEAEMPQVDLELKALASLDTKQKVDRAWFPALRAHYDGHCHWVDQVVGNFLEKMEKHPRFSQAGIILLSDHGEAFGEHRRILHNTTVYEPMIRIPFILKFPGSSFRSSKVNVPVDLIDVAPTVCGFAKLESPDLLQGIDLATVVLEPKSFEKRPLLSKALGISQDSLRYGPHKIIRRKIKQDDTYYLFHWLEDPGETQDLAEKERNLYKKLLGIFTREMNRLEMMEIKKGPVVRAGEEKEILRSLGYIGSEDDN